MQRALDTFLLFPGLTSKLISWLTMHVDGALPKIPSHHFKKIKCGESIDTIKK